MLFGSIIKLKAVQETPASEALQRAVLLFGKEETVMHVCKPA